MGQNRDQPQHRDCPPPPFFHASRDRSEARPLRRRNHIGRHIANQPETGQPADEASQRRPQHAAPETEYEAGRDPHDGARQKQQAERDVKRDEDDRRETRLLKQGLDMKKVETAPRRQKTPGTEQHRENSQPKYFETQARSPRLHRAVYRTLHAGPNRFYPRWNRFGSKSEAAQRERHVGSPKTTNVPVASRAVATGQMQP